MRIVHGYSKTLFYIVWKSIKARCLNKANKSFKNYGGRGIKVCNKWLNFLEFKNDMHSSYLEHKANNKTTTIERINNNGNYCPDNCCWITQEEQFLNCSPIHQLKKFIAISPQNETFEGNNQSKFAREHNLKPKKINDVLRGRRNFHSGWIFNYI